MFMAYGDIIIHCTMMNHQMQRRMHDPHCGLSLCLEDLA